MNEKPGSSSSVIAAPPTRSRCSSTSVRSPALARYAALTSPLWPPPTTMASYVVRCVSRGCHGVIAVFRAGLNRGSLAVRAAPWCCGG